MSKAGPLVSAPTTPMQTARLSGWRSRVAGSTAGQADQHCGIRPQITLQAGPERLKHLSVTTSNRIASQATLPLLRTQHTHNTYPVQPSHNTLVCWQPDPIACPPSIPTGSGLNSTGYPSGSSRVALFTATTNATTSDISRPPSPCSHSPVRRQHGASVHPRRLIHARTNYAGTNHALAIQASLHLRSR